MTKQRTSKLIMMICCCRNLFSNTKGLPTMQPFGIFIKPNYRPYLGLNQVSRN